jgi:hypothetical protein
MRFSALAFFMLFLVGCRPINQVSSIDHSKIGATSIVHTLITQSTITPRASLTVSPTQTNTPDPIYPAPAGLIYRSSDNVWIVNQNGEKELMATNITPEVDRVSLCSSGERFLLETFNPESMGGREYLTIEISTGKKTKLDPGKDNTFCFAEWWPNRCDTVLADIQPWPEVGRYCEGSLTKITLDGERIRLGTSASPYDLYEPSLDGKLLAYTQDNKPWIYQWGKGSQPINIKSDVFPFSNIGFIRPTWSPDNKKIAWLVWDKTDGWGNDGIAIYDIEKNSTEFFYPYEVWSGEFPSYLDWNRKNDLIKIETPDGHISVLNADGVELYTINQVVSSIWSPDGTWLTYTVVKDDIWATTIMSYDGKEQHEFGRNISGIWSPDNKHLLYADGSSYFIEEIGKWIPRKIDLPEDAVFVDWVNLEK